MLPSLSSVLCHLLQVPHQPPRPRFSSPSRSSSALNLALSQAASNAYANAHLAAGTHQCLGAAPLMDPSQSQGLRPLEDPCRTEGAGADGGACSHLHTADPCHFEYHAAQLEKFLTEYRCLQEQLIHMKQSYEAHKRAGSIPSLDCCPASAGGQRSDYPKGVTCCSCGHKGAYMQTAGVPPLPTEFAQTSLSDTTVTMPQTSAAATGFSDTPQPNEPSLDNNSTQATAGYAESFMPSRQYLDDGLAQQQGAGYVAMGETSVASPGTQSPARGSPKTNTLTKASKEPLKSILKKNTEGGGGRRRGDQWTRSASCCERRTGPAPLGDPAYAVAPDSRSKTTENLQPADLPRPAPGHGHYEP